MELSECFSTIDTSFKTVDKKDINYAFQLLTFILKQDKEYQPQLLQHICEQWGMVASNESISADSRITEADYIRLRTNYGSVVDSILISYTKQGLSGKWSREQFYEELWKIISSDVLFPESTSKAFALFYIAIDLRTPYYNVGDGVKMNQDGFDELLSKTQEAFREFRFVEALDFDQKTEKASLILNIIKQLDDDNQRIVLLVKIIGYYHKIIDKLKGD